MSADSCCATSNVVISSEGALKRFAPESRDLASGWNNFVPQVHVFLLDVNLGCVSASGPFKPSFGLSGALIFGLPL